MTQRRHDDADLAALPCDQAAGGEVGPVVELLGFGEHSFAGLRTDVRVVAHDLGDGHHRYSQRLRYVLHRYCHCRHPRTNIRLVGAASRLRDIAGLTGTFSHTDSHCPDSPERNIASITDIFLIASSIVTGTSPPASTALE